MRLSLNGAPGPWVQMEVLVEAHGGFLSPANAAGALEPSLLQEIPTVIQR